MRKILRSIILIAAVLVLVVVGTAAAFRLGAEWRETQTAEAIAPAGGRFIETSLGRIHVTIHGEENERSILMTHGMAAWGGLWNETAVFLAQNGYRVVAADLPPFGFSDRLDGDFSRSAQAERLHAMVEAMELSDYFLVGHSYGGGVAAELALRHNEGLDGMVLVSAVIRLGPETGKPRKGDVPFPLRWQGPAEWLVASTITNPLLTGFLAKQFMHRKERLTQQQVSILQAPMHRKDNTAHLVAWLKQFLAGDPDAWSRDRTKIREGGMPVALIWGDKDTVTPIAQGEELAALANPVSFARLDNVGHMPQLEDPEVFNSALLSALRALEQRSGPSISDATLRGSISSPNEQ